jgi:peptidoglycan/xylan/chitin deacetylase (PgdA/CDA1 family)
LAVYKISLNDLKIVEEYFDNVYHRYPGVYSRIVRVKNKDRTVKYIPTPLDYLDGKGDLSNMLRKINSLGQSSMASFFFHPNIEFSDIKITKDSSGYPCYTYSDSSALHQMINALEKKGYRFVTINDLK